MVCSMVFAGGSKEADPEDLTLRMLWWGGDTRHTPTLAALDKYTERTGISVEGEYAGWDGYYQRIVTQLAGGTAPDLPRLRRAATGMKRSPNQPPAAEKTPPAARSSRASPRT